MAVAGAQKAVACITQKGHAENCWCFVSLCVGYYCTEVKIGTIESTISSYRYLVEMKMCVTRVTVTRVTLFSSMFESSTSAQEDSNQSKNLPGHTF